MRKEIKIQAKGQFANKGYKFFINVVPFLSASEEADMTLWTKIQGLYAAEPGYGQMRAI